MSLVNYSSDSSSSSEADDHSSPPAKRVFRENVAELPLPIPTGLLETFKQKDLQDDSSKHGGRQRSFAHVKGNWATFVHVPCSDEFLSWLNPAMPKLFEYLEKRRGSKPFMSCARDGLHLSLSRVVPIQHHLITPLIKELTQKLETSQTFDCVVEKPRIYRNDDKSRSFLSLDVVQGLDKLKILLCAVDKVFVDFGLPKFYKEASFHVSVGWTLGELAPLSAKEEHDLISLLHLESSGGLPLTVHRVVCKTGNKLHNISLAT